MEIIEYKISDIIIEDNSRFDIKDNDLADLMKSIKETGLLQPIGVNETNRHLIYGHRRLAACKKLGWHLIPAIMFDADSHQQEMLMNLTENLKRMNISSYEEGRYFNILINDFKMTPSEIAARLGLPKLRVSASIEVFNHLPKEYRTNVVTNASGHKQGKISGRQAAKIISLSRKYKMTRNATTDLLNLSKQDGFQQQHLSNIAKGLSQGMKAKDVIDEIVKYKMVNLDVLIKADVIKKLESKHGASIQAIIINMIGNMIGKNAIIPPKRRSKSYGLNTSPS